MAPLPIRRHPLFALIELDCVVASCFGIFKAWELNKYYLALSRPLWSEPEQAPGTIRDAAVHRFAHDPRDEQSPARTKFLGKLHPLKVLRPVKLLPLRHLVDLLGVAETPGR